MRLTITRKTNCTGTEWKAEAENFKQHSREVLLDVDDEFIECILSKVFSDEVHLLHLGGEVVNISVFGRKMTTPVPKIIDTPEKLRNYIITITNTVKDLEYVTNTVTFEV